MQIKNNWIIFLIGKAESNKGSHNEKSDTLYSFFSNLMKKFWFKLWDVAREILLKESYLNIS